METLLRKYLWAIDLAVITLCAMLAARTTATLVETKVARAAQVVGPPSRTAGPETHAIQAKEVDDILRRNIFCSTCPPIIKSAGEKILGPPLEPAPQRTTLPLKLLAIMYAPPPADPHWSIAIIRDTEANVVRPHAIGGSLREATITSITDLRIDLEVAGRTEYLELFDKGATGPVVTVAAPAADPFMAALDKGIKTTGEHTFEVQRATVEALFENLAALSGAVRIVPVISGGHSTGFRLMGVRSDGPFAKIGLRSGDVVSAINGLEITGPDQALAAYSKLKSVNHLSVGLERGGRKITNEYTIR